MRLNCFKAAGANGLHTLDENGNEAPRPRPQAPPKSKSARILRRHASQDSRSSSTSNDSVSKLPPCKRVSDPKIEAMMMPVPPEPRASRCLRLSQPKTYSNIVDSMKQQKGCRDWRNFAVFHDNDVDQSMSAVDLANKRQADFERKWAHLNSFGTDDSDQSVEVDMIATSHPFYVPTHKLETTFENFFLLAYNENLNHTEPYHQDPKMSAAPSPTTTVFATNKLTDVKAQLTISKPTPTVQEIIPKAEKDEETIPPSPKQDKTPEIQRPYLKLLMPQPPVDIEGDIAARKQDCRYWFYVLGRNQQDKNWRSILVFPEDDVDEARS
ncbi:hypothetical protein KC324_g16865, partial [Hortaea werneckii]